MGVLGPGVVVLRRCRGQAEIAKRLVPGGRFREVYYWDSYFTMLGFGPSQAALKRNMVNNFAHQLRTYGHIPNGNRTYYLSRSQPPYFAAMVGLYARATDTTQALRYLEAMEREHAFWMAGAASVPAGHAQRRVVRLRDGRVLNRYWDDRPEPRPEHSLAAGGGEAAGRAAGDDDDDLFG